MGRPALPTPLVLVNYKVYPNALGREALRLTKALEGAAASFPEVTVAVAPGHAEISLVAGGTDLLVLAQSVSGAKPGSGTGRVLPESLADLGVAGALVNHAECQVSHEDAAAAVARLSELGLASVVCTADEAATRALAALEPSFVAVEPPELIGGDVSVTTADPGIVSRSVAAAREVDAEARVLCGAGVKNGDDVGKALELGTLGVLVASGVVKADDPAHALAGLLEGAMK